MTSSAETSEDWTDVAKTGTDGEEWSEVDPSDEPAKTPLPPTTTRIERRRQQLAHDRAGISIWNSPLTILKYISLYALDGVLYGVRELSKRAKLVSGLVAVLVGGYAAYVSEGSHQKAISAIENNVLWYGWWVVLGIASSIGLGAGLHTFVLFLGPHVAHTTITAYACHSTNFATRGPESFMCDPTTLGTAAMSIWSVAKKVRAESFFWGLGTALGEMPPYFVARAAASAGREDPNFASIDSITRKDVRRRTIMEKAQVMMYNMMQNLGFFGILLAASIPNPLFDLAGIMCGHFGIPFMTFFGATFLGKAVFKSSIQTLFVIFIFSEDALGVFLAELKRRAPRAHAFVQRTLDEQVQQFKKGGVPPKEQKSTWFTFLWNALLVGMIVYFAISLLESLAISRLKKEHDSEIRAMREGEGRGKGKGKAGADGEDDGPGEKND